MEHPCAYEMRTVSTEHWDCSSAVESLWSMRETLCSILGTVKKINKTEQNKCPISINTHYYAITGILAP